MTIPTSQLITMPEGKTLELKRDISSPGNILSQRGAPVRIAFFDDRIEIENPGILLPGLTVEDMLQGVSRIRNHIIARVFRELDLIEQWGSGVRRMFKEAEALGLPQPEIIEVGMRVRFIVYLTEGIAVETTDPVTGEVEVESPTQSNEPIQKLLLALTDEEKSSATLRSVLGIKERGRINFPK